jgi:hypothetical protein
LVNNSIPDFKTLDIDCVFTGTSHPDSSDSYEVNCIKQAKQNKIYVISFIDHWINFKLRFEGLREEEMPDEIWVVDEWARELAIKEQLPANKLVVHENPYHFYLKNYWRSAYSGKKYFNLIDIPEKGFHILFAPDPLSLRMDSHELGFTEAGALATLLDIIEQVESEVFVIIKAHPLQPADVLDKVLSKYSLHNYKLIREADNCELINASDLIIGFYSNFLLEAKALNKNLVRFFPGNPHKDLFRNNKNIEGACSNPEELKVKILNYIYE